MKRLRIENLVLIEKMEIVLDPALNIFTGETGAGKSAILSSLKLLAGQKFDPTLLRQGTDAAIVEAELEDGRWARRELYRSGKNRCFIDEAQTSLAELKESINLQIVDQNSASELLAKEAEILDSFANLLDRTALYEEKKGQENHLIEQLKNLEKTPKERQLEWAEKDLALLEALAFEPGEEEKLLQELRRHLHAQELLNKIGQGALTLREGGKLSELKRILFSWESCIKIDPTAAPFVQAFKSALLELEEATLLALHYAEALENDPHRLSFLEERIGQIQSLKKRFGEDLEKKKKELVEEIEELFQIDEKKALLSEKIEQLQKARKALSEEIIEKRRQASASFSHQVLLELQSLNMPDAQFSIDVSDAIGSVSFLFSANPGASLLPLDRCASGGELSRLLLAIKTILASDQKGLVFDEIDSNVGGKTAAILGEKLAFLSQKRQIICVTHFVQVAKRAMSHFLVSKNKENGKSFTSVKKLSEKEKENEYSRMLGRL